jgi:hypothetical protein
MWLQKLRHKPYVVFEHKEAPVAKVGPTAQHHMTATFCVDVTYLLQATESTRLALQRHQDTPHSMVTKDSMDGSITGNSSATVPKPDEAGAGLG